jgi:nucleotide-binding universal stress UspA family protein
MFEHLLVPLDGSPLAECVLPHTVALARALGSRVSLLRVLEPPRLGDRGGSMDPLDWHMRVADANAYLEAVKDRLQGIGLATECTLLEGQAAERVVDFARRQDVHLIVLSSHGQSGLSGWNISSVVQKIIMRAYVPTMIVRAYRYGPLDLTGIRYERVLVPLDGSQRAECVLPLAATLAQFHEADLLLVHVASRPEMPRRVPATTEDIELAEQIVERNRTEAARYLDGLRSRLAMGAEIRLLTAPGVAVALHDLAEQEKVDLVMLSAHGYSGGSRWPYGSVTTSFIAYGSGPLLIVQDLSPEEVERSLAERGVREVGGH